MNKVTILKALLLTIGFRIVLEIFGMSIFLTEYIDMEYKTLFLWASSTLFLVPHILLLILFYFLLKREDLWCFNEPNVMQTPLLFKSIAIILGVCFVYLQIPLYHIYDLFDRGITFDGCFVPEKFDFEFWMLPRILAGVILVPIVEELFFRGYLLKRLLDKHSAVIAILVSTLLFALIHLPDYIQAFNASVGGIVAGILYFKSKRIVIPILFHITWNLIAELDNFFKLPFM